MGINITLISYKVSNDYIEINENQTAIIPILLKDSNGSLLTPTKLRWQLTDLDGEIINERSFSVVQSVVDKIILNYDDTSITNGIDKLLLSIAVGVVIDDISYQQNAQIRIKLKDFVSPPPDVFEGLDDPFTELDSPFTELDETF